MAKTPLAWWGRFANADSWLRRILPVVGRERSVLKGPVTAPADENGSACCQSAAPHKMSVLRNGVLEPSCPGIPRLDGPIEAPANGSLSGG
jgi:hypothetical protein